MTPQLRRRVMPLAVAVFLLVSACGKRTPVQIAGDVAHNGAIVITAVDATQKFIAAQEAAGRIPRNQAVTAMEAIGRSLKAADTAGQYLDKLVNLPAASTDASTLIQQIQAALALAASEAAMVLVPIGDETVRGQIAKLITEVNTAIGQVNGLILSWGRK